MKYSLLAETNEYLRKLTEINDLIARQTEITITLVTLFNKARTLTTDVLNYVIDRDYTSLTISTLLPLTAKELSTLFKQISDLTPELSDIIIKLKDLK